VDSGRFRRDPLSCCPEVIKRNQTCISKNYHLLMCRENVFGRMCSVCLPVYSALPFESLQLESSIFVLQYILRIYASSSYIKFMGSRSGCILFAGGSIERHSCYYYYLLNVALYFNALCDRYLHEVSSWVHFVRWWHCEAVRLVVS